MAGLADRVGLAAHGVAQPRGLAASSAAPGGRYGRMFGELSAAALDEELVEGIAAAVIAAAGRSVPLPQLPAGYTYFGQYLQRRATVTRSRSPRSSRRATGWAGAWPSWPRCSTRAASSSAVAWSEAGDLLLGPARKEFEAHLMGADVRPHAAIIPAALGNSAGLVGAAELARDRT